MARFLTQTKHPLGQTCIANGDDCDPCEDVPLPWDRSWESSLPDSGPHPDHSSNTDPTLIPQCHAALITGLTSLYDTLISLRYLQPTDVQKPPHTSPKPAVAASKLRSCGFEPEVIELMSHLPYLTGSAYDRTRHSIHPFELAPSAMPQSYLEDVDDEHFRHARDPFGLYKNDIPPWALRLTVAWRGGTNHIYDTRDGTIAAWSPSSDSSAIYPTLPRYPASDVLTSLHSNFTTLTWIPWLTRHGPSLSTPPPADLLQLLREEPSSSDIHAIRTLAIERAGVNTYYGMRKLYREYGWPDRFLGEAFERARGEWNERLEELEAGGRRPVVDYEGGARVGELAEGLGEWLKERAGEEAV
ncbi:hypothetical protein MMC30_008289 [Trapelia coarctata]|nr:hypothetical protein [Trapelia coarctata]